jgi:hypothetical protein
MDIQGTKGVGHAGVYRTVRCITTYYFYVSLYRCLSNVPTGRVAFFWSIQALKRQPTIIVSLRDRSFPCVLRLRRVVRKLWTLRRTGWRSPGLLAFLALEVLSAFLTLEVLSAFLTLEALSAFLLKRQGDSKFARRVWTPGGVHRSDHRFPISGITVFEALERCRVRIDHPLFFV